ncbi:MAG: hypothetical protein II767_09180 [Proteobacteria bacterium]|nr:hypothetical protein [Pseudomonadota bacterium]MBQ4360416.1 hypothetical protein [Pseudomonadota bacterium]
MKKCLITICFALSLFPLIAHDAQALPRNFRNVDTFFVGAMPSEADLDEFYMLGIKTIISLHRLPPDVQKKAQKLGIKTHSFPLRTRLLNIEEIMDVMRNAPENSVYLHCLHGADRTGAVTAYWLYTERHINPFTALASVISPSDFHFRGLLQLGNEYGVCLSKSQNDWLGIYSGAKNGGLEGLKICGDEWYTRLARNFLTLTVGNPINEQDERFWKKYNGD